MHDEDPRERVPTEYPFGSVTDGTMRCGRCGQDLTGCALCAGMIRFLVPTRDAVRELRR